MSSLLERVFDLLTSEVGSLTYHLILAFSIVGALQITVGYYYRSRTTRFWRTVLGLCSLLVLQLALFIVSGFAWQGIIEGNFWLPALERAVNLVSLIIVIWLWAIPDPKSSMDLGTLLLGAFSLVAIFFGFLWLANQGSGIVLNGSKLDVANQVFCLCLAIIGCLLLIIRRPDGWGLGIGMLFLMLLGNVFQLLLFQQGQDYPGALRLGLLAAYPFLLFLPQRIQLTDVDRNRMAADTTAGFNQAKDRYSTGHPLSYDPQIWKSIYTLVTESQPEAMCKAIVDLLAKAMQADICLMLAPHDDSDRVTIQCGYDAHTDRHLEKVIMYRNSLPVLASSLRMGRIRQMASGSASPDMVNLAHAFELERTGNLLSIPVLSSDGKAIFSIVLLSPYSDRNWSTEDQSILGDLARLMVHFLQHNTEVVDLKNELEQVRQNMHTTQDQLQQAIEERQKLSHQFAVVQENSQRDQAQLATMSVALSNHDKAEKTAEHLQDESHELGDVARMAAAGVKTEETSGAELRLALEEIAFLSSALSDADRKIQSLKIQDLEETPPNDQIGALLMISQDLRQPFSSIVNYADLLLSGSIGVLDETQRKYVERIKGSTERISRLIDELIQIASLKGSPKLAELKEIDVNAVVSQAAADVDIELREKHITVELQLPDQPLRIVSDNKTLERIMIILLQNAATVTPDGGKITIGAQLESSESKLDYVLIQVTDTGGGISAQDLPRVFSPRMPSTQIPGLGDSEVDLPSVKILVEMLNGRVWVDGEPDQGSIFSVLLPVTSSVGVDRDGLGEG